MGIFNVRVEGINQNSATVRWQSTVVATTELAFGQAATDGTCNLTELPKQAGNDSLDHSYPLNGLTPGQTYCIQAKSFDNNNLFDYLPCDDGTDMQHFDTTQDVGDVTSLTVTSDKTEMNMGGTATLTLTAKAAGGAANNRLVTLSIFNGNDRGEFRPSNEVRTGAGGTVQVEFNALKNGKAKIQAVCEQKSSPVEILVRPPA